MFIRRSLLFRDGNCAARQFDSGTERAAPANKFV
ncbi:hemolysin transporter protein shlB, partial [Yersinia pestis PY-103]